MSRKRQWCENSYLHITIRGNRKEEIFREKGDYRVFLHCIYTSLEYFNDFNIEIVSYCLMTNHVHLLIRTGVQQPGLFMARLISVYTRYFNNKYGYVGRLFQAMYKSEIITDDQYLLEASRYIHLNPCKAKIVELPSEYMWSSYNNIINENLVTMYSVLINENIILDYFNNKIKRRAYKNFVEEKLLADKAK